MSISRARSVFRLAAVVSLSFLVHSAALTSRAVCQENDAAVAPGEGKTKILLLATPPDHPYGTHMYRKGCEILAHCLRQNSGVEAVVCEGWPSDPKMVEGVKAIALYSGPGDFVLRGPHRERFAELISQGVGFSAVHWSTGAMPDRAEQYKSCLGGYFTPKFGLNTTTTTLEQVARGHPICRGWSDFELTDEIYLNPDLLPATKTIAKVRVPDRGGSEPKDHTVAWAYQRPGSSGGRSFGCSLGHFHSLFVIEGLRRLLVNGILWTSDVEIPSSGAACDIDPSELELPPDPAIVAEVKRHDKNADGDLEDNELKSLVNDRIEKQKDTKLFLQVFDKDKDGTLSDLEIEQARPPVKAHFLQQCRQGNVRISAAGQPAQRQDLVASLNAVDLATLVIRCGGPDPIEDSLELVRKLACSRERSQTGEVLAFEENRQFVYALAQMTHAPAEGGDRPQQAVRWLRRVVLLKPSILVVEDTVRAPGREGPIHWTLRSTAEPKIEANRFCLTEVGTEILGETVLPADAALKMTVQPARDDRPGGFRVEVTPQQTSHETRFLHVFHLGRSAGPDGPTRPKMAKNGKRVELTVRDQEKVFRLTLPIEGLTAGKIEITEADGAALVPSRLLPSGVMPHGPQGAKLMERWDAPYRRERLPGWDVGRPCSHLVEAVEKKTFKPGRAIVFGCGSGTNAIYLAGEGFEVTGVDVSPAALAIAEEKAQEAGVQVDWILADVVSLPALPPYDLIFDRGCYHHVCQYDSPGYVEALRKLSRAGTRALVLAGSPADGRRGGPPRIKEETIRNDFSTLFEFDWLRNVHFDSRNPDAKGSSAWSIHLRRKEE